VRGILYTLSGAMKEKYLLPVLRGEKRTCFAQTEPDAGSDPGGMRTTAVRDGEIYVINGSNVHHRAHKADFMQLMPRPIVPRARMAASRASWWI